MNDTRRKPSEIGRVLGLSDKDIRAIGRMNHSVKASPELVVARVGTLYADLELREQSSARIDYMDAAGEFGNSAKGFMIQVNKRIKARFEKRVAEIGDKSGLDALKTIRLVIAKRIHDMMKAGNTHAEIKRSCYRAIDEVCNVYGFEGGEEQ